MQELLCLGKHQLLVYVDDVNILEGSVRTVKENTEVFLVASKEIGLEINTDKIKYMVISRDRNTRRSHNMNIDNRSLERGRRVQIFGKNVNKSKFYSGRN